jgi:hypothetical protein
MQGGEKVTRKVFLVLLALVLTLSVGLVACGGAGEQQEEEEEEEEEHGEQEEEEEEEEETYDLTIASTAGGSVTTPGEGTSNYDEDAVVNLVATSDSCYHFVNWTGDVSTVADVNDAATTITVNGDYAITANFEEGVTFADPNLEAAIREEIDKPTGGIYPSDLDELTFFDVEQMGNITDLTGLDCCTSLSWLSIWGNQISDISPLANLTNLTFLDLADNQISDISPLANLTSLTFLDLSDNQISDISSLVNLTSLIVLDLYSNQISDISPLANLTSLTDLGLYSNQISDISSLVNLTSLTWLIITANQISDISPLVDNEGLSEGDKVYLTGNPLSSASVNTYIPQLEARGVEVDY